MYAGAGPAWSPAVQGFIHFLPDSAWYALSTDPEDVERWLTEKEAAQRQAQADRAAREAAEKHVKAAERRIQELEALLARGR